MRAPSPARGRASASRLRAPSADAGPSLLRRLPPGPSSAPEAKAPRAAPPAGRRRASPGGPAAWGSRAAHGRARPGGGRAGDRRRTTRGAPGHSSLALPPGSRPLYGPRLATPPWNPRPSALFPARWLRRPESIAVPSRGSARHRGPCLRRRAARSGVWAGVRAREGSVCVCV